MHEGRPLSTRMNMFGSIRKYFVQNEKYENKITVFKMPDVLSPPPKKIFDMKKVEKVEIEKEFRVHCFQVVPFASSHFISRQVVRGGLFDL